MAQLRSKKFAFVSILLGFLLYTWLYRCDDETSYVWCKPLNTSATVLRPYLEPAQPYVSKASHYVHQAAIDPINSKVSELYGEYLQDHVEMVDKQYVQKYYQILDANAIHPLKSKVIYPLAAKSEQVYRDAVAPKAAIYGAHAQKHAKKISIEVFNFTKSATIYSKDKIIKYSTIFTRNLVNVYVPTFIEYINKTLVVLNKIVKPRIVAFYHQFLEQHALTAYKALKIDIAVKFVKDIYLKVVTSSQYSTAVVYVKAAYSKLIPRSYDEVESKKEFVKSEFNKIFDAGFQLRQDFQERFKSSNKLIKDKLYNKSLTTTSTTEKDATSSSTTTETSSDTTPTIAATVEPTKGENEISKSINFWNSAVSKTCEAAIDELHEEISTAERATVDLYQPKLTSALQDLSKTIHDGYRELTRIVGTIDQTDISRQEFRDVLAKMAGDVSEKSDVVKSLLKEESSNFSEFISQKRSKILELVEEFADFAIQEFSKELITDRKKDDQYWQNWKELNKIKDILFSTREKLLNLKPESKQLDKVIADIERTLNIFSHESGEYLAISRAKANLAFQLREERERQVEAAMVASAIADAEREEVVPEAELAGDEEDFEEVETQTLTKTFTVTEPSDEEASSTVEPAPTSESILESEPEPVADPVSDPVDESVTGASAEEEVDNEASTNEDSEQEVFDLADEGFTEDEELEEEDNEVEASSSIL